jgi:dolichyl-phosphate-mannose--protein O-mannosyl transferase
MSTLTRPAPPPSLVRPPSTWALRWQRFVSKINRPVVAILAVAAIAGYLRFVHLAYPEHRVFDEYYYTKSACIFLGYSDDRCDINSADERFWRDNEWDTGAWVHPPLGKWMIALGEKAFGTESMGWRVSAAATGTATVILLAVIIQLLFASPIWTFTGGLLLATESLNLVLSRTGILDIFVAFWVVLIFVFLLLDRRWIERRTDDAIAVAGATAPPPIAGGSDASVETIGGDGSSMAMTGEGAESHARPSVRRRLPTPLWRPYRFAAGAAGGAAMATKWSGITAVVTAAAIGFGWEVMRRRRFGVKSPFVRTLTTEGFGLVLALAITPAIVYFVTYIPWFVHFHWDLAKWADDQQKAWNFHRDLRATDDQGQPWSAYFSPAWQWILLRRPVYFYGAFPTEGVRQVIYAQGNPVIFWGSILAIPYTAYAWWRDRDWRAAFVFVTVAGLYLPWFAVSRPQFLFYAAPITPFFVLACVYALRDLSEMHVMGSRSRPFLPLAVGLVAASVILFLWFWPVLTAGRLSDAGFMLRVWFPSWT